MFDVYYGYKHERFEIPLMNLVFSSSVGCGASLCSLPLSLFLLAITHCFYIRGLFVWWWMGQKCSFLKSVKCLFSSGPGSWSVAFSSISVPLLGLQLSPADLLHSPASVPNLLL